ncbi:MAG: radical SAM protein, partial [Anaerovorax sp.]
MAIVLDKVQAFGLKHVIKYCDSDPETNLPKILDWVEKLDKDKIFAPAYKAVSKALEDPDNNWHILMNRLFTDIDDS